MQHISFSFLGFVSLQQIRSDTSCKVKNNHTLGEYRRELQQLYQIRIETSVYMVNLSEQCESVDNILTDKILNNELSKADLQAKSDKPFAVIKVLYLKIHLNLWSNFRG